jgi:hypothetical protein
MSDLRQTRRRTSSYLAAARRLLVLAHVQGRDVSRPKDYAWSLLGALVHAAAAELLCSEVAAQAYVEATITELRYFANFAVHPVLLCPDSAIIPVLASWGEQATKAQCLDLINDLIREVSSRDHLPG